MKDATYWYELIRDKFLSLCQSITNFNIGSRIRSIFESVGLALEELSFRAEAMYQGLFAQTAKDEDLDWRGLELGLTRKPAKSSTGYVRFTGDENTQIPKDTICSTDISIEPVIEFLTFALAVIPSAGYIDVKVESKETGKKTNVEANKVDYLPQSIAGISEIKNLSAISGGEDEEDDESFRKRIVLRWYEANAGGTENYFRSIALSIDGIYEARVKPCAYGPGTVLLYVWSKNEQGALIPASDTLIESVKEAIEDKKPLCIQIYIEKPLGIIQDVFLFIQQKAGYNFNTVRDEVDGVIRNYFNSLQPGQTLVIARLISEIMSLDTISDIKLELPKTNISVPQTQSIILGNLIIQPFEDPRQVRYAIEL